jgi:hypothetical protein
LLIEVARLCDVEPRGYLSEAVRRAIRDPGMGTPPLDLKVEADGGLSDQRCSPRERGLVVTSPRDGN